MVVSVVGWREIGYKSLVAVVGYGGGSTVIAVRSSDEFFEFGFDGDFIEGDLFEYFGSKFFA